MRALLFVTGLLAGAYANSASTPNHINKRVDREFWEYQGYFSEMGPYMVLNDLPEGVHNSRYKVPLQFEDYQCFNTELNATDLRKAEENMGDWCEHFQLTPRSIYSSIVNDVTVFSCSEGHIEDCHPVEWREVSAYLDKKCGKNMAGTVLVKGFKKKHYGRVDPFRWICPRLAWHASWDYAINPEPVWVDGKMYEEWKFGKGFPNQ